MTYRTHILLGCALSCLSSWGHAATVTLVDPATLSGTAVVDFEDLNLGLGATVNYDGEFESGTVQFSAGFVGQTIGVSGFFDTVSGSPSGPLALFDDAANQNILAVDGGDGNFGNTSIAGLGPLGFPTANAIGEGVISVLFDFDQSEFGFDLIGGDGGTATLQFFGRDGSLLTEITTNPLFGTLMLGFATDDTSKSIAGVTILNSDPGGVGVDNVRSDVRGVIGPPPVGPRPEIVPLPAGILLLGSGLLALGAARRESRRRAR
ncbi:hypothetical protein [Roseobacter sinensis]|uniref:Uncharacterized protein n=1 Tax=Roseobacter sinensis TaxID=2931391 RepID=A0ABT3BM61_9RHOB|nr:hypothetical protein [Roseobacter sp. WL0113]MCV3274334.1 hypothetical protein [Roseobacter sp. WL0113]